MYYELGPQGRELTGSSYYRENAAVPQELDFLVNNLRSPTPDLTVSKALGYLYHYIPYVKYEHNLRVIIASFLNSPVCFAGNTSFEDNYLIIEVFKLISEKKLKISQPTLSLKTFYTVLEKELTHFVEFNPPANSWKVLPIIAGLQLSDEIRDVLHTRSNVLEYQWFFSSYDTNMAKLFRKCLHYSLSPTLNDNVVNLSILSLAIAYKKNTNLADYTTNISSIFLIRRILGLLYLNTSSLSGYTKFLSLDPMGGPNMDEYIQKEILQRPVIKHVNKLSFLLEGYLKDLKFTPQASEVIDEVLSHLYNFNHRLNVRIREASQYNDEKNSANPRSPHRQLWYVLKGILFSQTIIFQGILTRFVVSNRSYWPQFFGPSHASKEVQYKRYSLKILHCLYQLNFVLLSIGQGGFDNYNFVYYLAIEIALGSPKEFQDLTMQMVGNYTELNLHHGALNYDYVARTKVLFVLGLWENYLQSKVKNGDFVKKEIFDLCIHLADDKKYTDFSLIEAAHSVLLLCFSNQNDDDINESIRYVELLFSQFPTRLSSNQLSIAIETIGKKILSGPGNENKPFTDPTEEFTSFLLNRASNIIPGLNIKSITDQTNKFASAQPIPEIEANSTLRNMDKKSRKEGDIIDANKMKKPKDIFRLDVLPHADVGKEYEFQARYTPETVREGYIVSIINLVPYLPLSKFTRMLNSIWVQITRSDPAETKFLKSILWKVLSENLDLNRAELAYRWWYMDKEVPSKL